MRDETAARAVDERRPVHLRPGALALVALGGTAGTAAREAVSLAVPAVDGIPVAIFGVNVVGAFALGLLLEALARSGPDAARRQRLRLLLGTGLLGGFTTYSALAVDSAALVGGATPVGLAYALATLAAGALASWAGIGLGVVVGHRPSRRP